MLLTHHVSFSYNFHVDHIILRLQYSRLCVVMYTGCHDQGYWGRQDPTGSSTIASTFHLPYDLMSKSTLGVKMW